MHFDESLFDDFQSKEKAERKQSSYEARNQELGVSIAFAVLTVNWNNWNM